MTKKSGAVVHVPQRTCIACGKITAKRELVRIVNCAGQVQVDETGKKPGRGVYLCLTGECWTKGLKSKKLEHSLGAVINPDGRQALALYASNINKQV